ncbi:MAG: hypothetical protein H6581_24500 [Bacteroidia bacterium]|nr:hypothetical protein [Bacteroidia bacterium]
MSTKDEVGWDAASYSPGSQSIILARIARILDKIQQVLDLHDGKKKLPGQIGDRWFGPVIGREAIHRFERHFGFPLPADFVEFVCTVGNGGIGPDHGWNTPFDPDQMVAGHARLLPFHSSDNKELEGPMAMIETGGEGCGMFRFLVVWGEGNGQMWFSDSAGALSSFGLSFTEHLEAWLDGLLVGNPNLPELLG